LYREAPLGPSVSSYATALIYLYVFLFSMNRVIALLSDALYCAMPNDKLFNAWKKSLRSEIDYLLVCVEAGELPLFRDVLAAAVNEGESPDVAGRFRMIAWISTDKRVSIRENLATERPVGPLLTHRRTGAPIFRNIVHDLAVATTSRTDRSALTRPLQECGKETCRPIGTCPAPITSERDQEAAQSTLEDRPRRRIRPPDGGRWGQMVADVRT
jgi:hypothetical protein